MAGWKLADKEIKTKNMLKKYLLLILKHKILKVIYATVLLFIALEVIARLVWGVKSTKLFNETVPDMVLHHKARPNMEVVDNGRSIPYTLRTNSQSWVEDYDVTKEKPAETYRIFYVGDSNTVGLIDSYKKMAEIVEAELNKIYKPKGMRIEVINTGSVSYSPLLYFLLIKTRIMEYNPDLVVINVDMTDASNDAVYRKSAVNDSQGVPIAVRPNFDADSKYYLMTPQGSVKISKFAYFRMQLHQFLVSHSVLFYQFETFVNKLFKGKLPTFLPHAMNYVSEDRTANWVAQTWTSEIEDNVAYSMKILEYAISLLKSNKVKVYITGVPHYPQFTGAWSTRPHEVLGTTAAKYSVPYLNTYEEMKKYTETTGTDASAFYWKEDGTHLNSEGNALWAKIQLEFLLNKKNELLP